MEYKLSKSEFYRIGYLLAGLFMFLFLFGIFSLSSYADSDSCLIVKTGSGGASGGSTTVTVSNTISINYTISSPNAVTHFTSYLYVTTTEGTYLLRSASYSKASGNFTDNMGLSGSFSVTLPGDFVNAYVTAEADDNLYVGGSVVYDPVVFLHSANDFISYRRLPSSISDVIKNYGYTNLTPLKFSIPAVFNSNFFSSNDGVYNVGDDCSVFYDNYNSSSLVVGQTFAPFRPSGGKVLYLFSLPDGATVSNFVFYYRPYAASSLQSYSFNDFFRFGNFAYDGVLYNFYALSIDLEYRYEYDTLLFAMGGSCSTTMKVFYQGAFYYNGSVSDYMSFVQSQWDDISPSVTDLNQNTSQSVSDIGTAQSFETSAFTDFDSTMSSSGLDTFSLSFVSTPLLWCASIINTFYNNMPSGFQYLLMFVAFVGILVIVLNIAGRVVRRFGGD